MKFVPRIAPGDGSVLPDGEYPFEVVNAEEKESKSSGADMLELTHKIKGGGQVYDYLVYGNPDAEWKLVNFLGSIGYDIKPGVPVEIDPDRLIGCRGTCVLYTDTYQGKKKNKITDYVIAISGPGAGQQAGQQPPSPKDKWR
jgi:uncharacterized protein DUF669